MTEHKTETTPVSAAEVLDDIVAYLHAEGQEISAPVAQRFARGLTGLHQLHDNDAKPAYQLAALAVARFADRSGPYGSELARAIAEHYAQKGGIKIPERRQTPGYAGPSRT